VLTGFTRILLLLLGIMLTFAAVVIILLRLVPGPYSELDYLVIGAVATFVSLLLLFLILVKTWVKDRDTFFKRRNR
jgi:hypothetical protein